MSLRNALAEAVKAVSQEGAVLPPADEATIAQAEQRLAIRLPPDMALFYRSMNGMARPTEPDNGWIRFWDLHSWHRVRDEPGLSDALSTYSNLADTILVADHCDSSWWYAADFAPGTKGLNIHLVDGLRPAKLVATSFTAFVNAALADAADIYPDEAG
jgi:hypothetical protein